MLMVSVCCFDINAGDAVECTPKLDHTDPGSSTYCTYEVLPAILPAQNQNTYLESVQCLV